MTITQVTTNQQMRKAAKDGQAQTIDATLKVLRAQRDDKQTKSYFGTFDVQPQLFQTGPHYVSQAIYFAAPFLRQPTIVFGQIVQHIIQDPTVDSLNVTGHIPLVLHPYVYAFQQNSSAISAFYLGLYALTPVPDDMVTKYTICWQAQGKGSPYPQQRIDEAWTSAYDKNKADYLVNDQLAATDVTNNPNPD